VGLFGDGLRQIEVDGIVVTIAPLEATRGEGSEGIALEVPRLLCEEVGIEDIAVVPRSLVLLEVQAISGPADKVRRDDEIVKEIPHVTISERATARRVKGCHGIEEVGRRQAFSRTLGAQAVDNAGRGGVVVEVPHEDDLIIRICCEEGVRDRAHDFGCVQTTLERDLLATDARRPVSDEERYGFAEQEAIDLEDVTRLDMLLPLEDDGVWVCGSELIVAGAIEERAVDTALVGRVEVDDLVARVRQLGFLQEVFEYASILDLTDPEDIRSSLRADLADSVGHIVKLLLVLVGCPLVLPVGQEVGIVILPVDGVEEVLQIVEGYREAHLLLGLEGAKSEEKGEGESGDFP